MSDRAAVRALRGAPFTKMTGSGNDFVVFHAGEVDRAIVTSPEVIRAICNRHNGIGADGVVFLEPSTASGGEATTGLRYFNSDGSLGELCGNATLCSTQLAVSLGFAAADHVLFSTDAGRVTARLRGPTPQIDLAPVTEVIEDLDTSRSGLPVGEHVRRAGFALAGVPHVVLLTDMLDTLDVSEAGRPIRQHGSLAPAGANVNWVMPLPEGGWRYRTYERGVEGETLACGTGAVACAILLTSWGLASGPVRLVTESGKPLEVSFRSTPTQKEGKSEWEVSLSGEGRVVFRGTVGELG